MEHSRQKALMNIHLIELKRRLFLQSGKKTGRRLLEEEGSTNIHRIGSCALSGLRLSTCVRSPKVVVGGSSPHRCLHNDKPDKEG